MSRMFLDGGDLRTKWSAVCKRNMAVETKRKQIAVRKREMNQSVECGSEMKDDSRRGGA